MDPLVIVSPHFDDAVLSAGQLMAGRPDCIVVTVFGGTPDRWRMLTSYDQACGFTSASAAVSARRDENQAALGRLGATGRDLGFLDHQYREVDTDAAALDPMAIADALARVLDETGARMAMGPLGLAHPDHELCAEAFRILLSLRRQIEPWVYEDMPSRVLWPEQVPGRLVWWAQAGFSVEKGFAGTGPVEQKRDAIGEYESQITALQTVCEGTLYPVLVPERHWRLWRSEP